MHLKNCGHKHNSDCGCSETALTTPPSCPQNPNCPDPEQCAQIWSAHCVIWTGDPIVDLDINPGDRVDEIIQKLVLLSTNPGCIDPTSSCNSVINLHSTTIGQTVISVEWTGTSTATNYQVEFKEATSLTWLLNPSVTPPAVQDSIGGLLPDTEYHIRVNTTCASGNCYSLTILVKTNP